MDRTQVTGPSLTPGDFREMFESVKRDLLAGDFASATFQSQGNASANLDFQMSLITQMGSEGAIEFRGVKLGGRTNLNQSDILWRVRFSQSDDAPLLVEEQLNFLEKGRNETEHLWSLYAISLIYEFLQNAKIPHRRSEAAKPLDDVYGSLALPTGESQLQTIRRDALDNTKPFKDRNGDIRRLSTDPSSANVEALLTISQQFDSYASAYAADLLLRNNFWSYHPALAAKVLRTWSSDVFFDPRLKERLKSAVSELDSPQPGSPRKLNRYFKALSVARFNEDTNAQIEEHRMRQFAALFSWLCLGERFDELPPIKSIHKTRSLCEASNARGKIIVFGDLGFEGRRYLITFDTAVSTRRVYINEDIFQALRRLAQDPRESAPLDLQSRELDTFEKMGRSLGVVRQSVIDEDESILLVQEVRQRRELLASELPNLLHEQSGWHIAGPVLRYAIDLSLRIHAKQQAPFRGLSSQRLLGAFRLNDIENFFANLEGQNDIARHQIIYEKSKLARMLIPQSR